MNDIEQFTEFFNGSLDSQSEQGFFHRLAVDSGLRAEFRAYAAITGAINSNRKAFAPTAMQTNSIFAAAGINISEIHNADSDMKTKSGFGISRVFTVITTALIALLISVPATYYYLGGNNNHAESVGSVTKRVSGSIHAISGISGENSNSVNNSTPRENTIIKYVYFDRNPESIAGHDRESIDASTLVLPEKIDVNSSIEPAQRILLGNTGNLAPVSFQIPTVTMDSDVKSREDFCLEAANNPAWTIPEAKITPDEFSPLNNLSIALFYTVDEKLKLGAELSMETFYAEYKGKDTDGSVYRIRQQPNFTTITANARYTPFGGSALSPFVQLGLGGNQGGYVIKPSVGFEYAAYPDMSFVFGVEYNLLRFNHQSVIYWAEKLDIKYGLLFKF